MQQHGYLQETMTRHHCRVFCVAAGFFFFSPIVAVGQSPPEPPPPSNTSERSAGTTPIEVQVIGEKPDALQAIPGSGTVVTGRQIDHASPLNVGEMLRRVPGLQVREDEGAGLRLDVSVRGLDGTRSRRVLMLEDGIPVAINPYGEPDLYYGPPIERMRGIEVVKGSGSILFGPQTIGGVINFLTIAPPTRREIRLEARGGLPNYLRLLGRYGDAVGNTRYVVQVFHKRGDGGFEQPFQSTDALGKIRFSTSASGRATLKIGIHDEVVTSTDVGLTTDMFARDPTRPTIAPDDEVRLRHYDVSLVHEQIFDADTQLKTLVYAYTTARLWRRQDYDRRARSDTEHVRVVGDTTVPFGAIFFRSTNSIRDRSYDVFGIEPRFEKRFTTGIVRHNLDVGARFLAESARRDQRAGASPTAWTGEAVSAETHHSLAFAAYVQDRMVFRDNLHVVPGVRMEHVRSGRDITRQLEAGIPTDVAITGTNVVTAFIPGMGLVLGSSRIQAFGGLHVGFAPPRVPNTINASDIAKNLDAERSMNYEVGTRMTPEKWLRFEVTGFLSNFENQIIASNRTDGATTDLINGGRTRHLGFEGSTTMKLGNLLHLGLALDLNATYTFVQATFVGGDLDGRVLPYAPQHAVSTNLDFEHSVGLGGQVAFTYFSSQFANDQGTVEPDASGRVGLIEGYPTLDAVVQYRHAPSGLSSNLAMKNVLGVIAIASRRPDGIFPTRMRQILLGLRWDHE